MLILGLPAKANAAQPEPESVAQSAVSEVPQGLFFFKFLSSAF